MKYGKLVLIILIFLVLIISILHLNNEGSSENKIFPEGEIKNYSIPWRSETYILTPFNDNIRVEIISHFNIPKRYSVQDKDFTIIQKGKLISEIDFYMGDQKKNFNDFFYIEDYNYIENEEAIKIISRNKFSLNESVDIKLIFYIQPLTKFYDINNNTAKIVYSYSSTITPDELYEQYIFRVPTINAQNAKLQFDESNMYDSKNIHYFLPISKLYITDKYVEIGYIFWNNDMFNKSFNYSRRLISLSPNSQFNFQTRFTVEYDPFRIDWIIQAVVFAILLTVTFYLGTLWQRRSRAIERIKPPK